MNLHTLLSDIHRVREPLETGFDSDQPDDGTDVSLAAGIHRNETACWGKS